MAICKDPALTYLNRLGYNVVRYPREGIAPLDILGRDGRSLERLGALPQIWTSTRPPPPVQADLATSEVSGSKTASMKLSVGLKILENVLRGMGGSPHLSTAYQRARSVRFAFAEVHADRIDPFAVGAYLAAGDLATGNPFVGRYFGLDDAEAYVLTEVLKSSRIEVVAEGEGGASVEVDVPAIQAAIGASVKVEGSVKGASAVSYEGARPLVFGFKAYAISFEDGAWGVAGVKPSEDLAFDDPTAVAAPPPLLGGFGLLALREGY